MSSQDRHARQGAWGQMRYKQLVEDLSQACQLPSCCVETDPVRLCLDGRDACDACRPIKLMSASPGSRYRLLGTPDLACVVVVRELQLDCGVGLIWVGVCRGGGDLPVAVAGKAVLLDGPRAKLWETVWNTPRDALGLVELGVWADVQHVVATRLCEGRDGGSKEVHLSTEQAVSTNVQSSAAWLSRRVAIEAWCIAHLSFAAAGMLQDHQGQATLASGDLHPLLACTDHAVSWFMCDRLRCARPKAAPRTKP